MELRLCLPLADSTSPFIRDVSSRKFCNHVIGFSGVHRLPKWRTNYKPKERNKNESTYSVQNNTNFITPHRTSARRARLARGRAECRDLLERDCVYRDRGDCGTAAASVGAKLRDGAGRGV